MVLTPEQRARVREIFMEHGGEMTVEDLTRLCLQAEVFSRTDMQRILIDEMVRMLEHGEDPGDV